MPGLSFAMFMSVLAGGLISIVAGALSQRRIVLTILMGLLPVAALVGLWFIPTAYRAVVHGPLPSDSEGGPYTFAWAAAFAELWLTLALALTVVGAVTGRLARGLVVAVQNRFSAVPDERHR